MSNSDYYIHLQSKTMNPCFLTKEAYIDATNTWLCTGCIRPKPEVTSLDVRIQDIAPEGPLNFVNGCGLPLVHMSVLSALGEERIKRDLYLGRVFGPDASRLGDWATFRGKRRVIIRGSEHVSHRVCSDCGRDVYFAMGTRYLYPLPPRDAEIFESHLFGLVLSESVAATTGMAQLGKVTRERLKVLCQPHDGLPPLSF